MVTFDPILNGGFILTLHAARNEDGITISASGKEQISPTGICWISGGEPAESGNSPLLASPPEPRRTAALSLFHGRRRPIASQSASAVRAAASYEVAGVRSAHLVSL